VQKYEKYVGEMFITKDVDFLVYTSNSWGSSMGLFPIPIPYWSKENGPTEPPFTVEVILKPHKSSALFDPQKVIFWENTSSKYTPTLIQGPYNCKSSKPRPDFRSFPVEPFELKETIYSCMWLKFDVVPPDPDHIFFVELAGLMFNGNQYPLPIIKFEKSKKTESFAVP
jgi:hypothetical protein